MIGGNQKGIFPSLHHSMPPCRKKTQVQLGLSQSIDPLCIFPGFYFYNCVCKMTLLYTYSVLIICRSTIYKVCFTVKKATIFIEAMLI